MAKLKKPKGAKPKMPKVPKGAKVPKGLKKPGGLAMGSPLGKKKKPQVEDYLK